MSKAFVKDDDGAPEEDAPLPPRSTERVPITARGHAALQAELAALAARGDGATRRARVIERILGGVYVQAPAGAPGTVGFDATVVVEDDDGAHHTYRIVGPDEADAAAGLVSSSAPLARALLGKRVGDVAVVRKPKGEVELTIVSVTAGVV